MTQIALKTEKLTIQFGGLKAVNEFDIEIKSGMIFGLIGPNGAGKTTVFNMLTGVYQPTSGSIIGFNKNLVGLKPFQITHAGFARTFQNIRLFKNLTVLQNLQVAMDQNPKHKKFGLLSTLIKTAKLLESEGEKTAECLSILKIFNLDSRAEEIASNLPYGDQRRLEIARAIATGSRLLLLDEPAAGMNSKETASLMHTIKDVRKIFDATVLLIEHDMKLVMGICERIAVLDYGVKIAEGTPSEIQKNPRVIEAYLGKAATNDQAR
ncbi:MAG: ABC transporter ATP-binding protein [Proteobacteria bacterium]|nr:ABC transporter ATP-binding protein [Pseudomonadota bacterium]